MKKLKKLRTEKQYTYKDMAQLLDISKPYYWQIENRKRGLSYEMAYKIAGVFNKRPDEVFYDNIHEYSNSKTRS